MKPVFFLLTLSYFAQTNAMERPSGKPTGALAAQQTTQKTPISLVYAEEIKRKVDAAIGVGDVAVLEKLQKDIKHTDGIMEVTGDPRFFHQLALRIQSTLWTLSSSNSLIDDPDAKEKKEIIQLPPKPAADPLLSTMILGQMGQEITAASPYADSVAKAIALKLPAKERALAAKEKEQNDLAIAAREAAKEVERLKQEQAALKGAYHHIATVNPDAVDPKTAADIRDEEAGKKAGRWFTCLVS